MPLKATTVVYSIKEEIAHSVTHGIGALMSVIGLTMLIVYSSKYGDAWHIVSSGIYGSTFFILTGFHGFHVAMGMTMLLIQWLRSVRGGHFTTDDHFGFEASSWYWHFVDVVWVFLFLFVYIL